MLLKRVNMTAGNRYPRDMLGYGRTPPAANWPDNAAICLQFVINFEEGGENCILHGIKPQRPSYPKLLALPGGSTSRNMESIYEYGSRAGFWRLHRLFMELNIPVTVYGVASALQRAPDQVAQCWMLTGIASRMQMDWYKDHCRERN